MCYKKGETAPTAEDILNEGILADNSETSIQRAIALEAETCYIIQAAVVSQGRYLLSEALEMKTQPVYENDVPVVKLKLLEKASYRTDNEPGNGNYVIRLASGEIGKDDLPTNIGDYLVRLDLYNVADSDPWNATLPAGEYHAGEETAQIGCWDVETTNVFTRISSDPANGVVYSYVTGGTVLVQRKVTPIPLIWISSWKTESLSEDTSKVILSLKNMSRKHHRALTSLLRKIKRCLSL